MILFSISICLIFFIYCYSEVALLHLPLSYFLLLLLNHFYICYKFYLMFLYHYTSLLLLRSAKYGPLSGSVSVLLFIGLPLTNNKLSPSSSSPNTLHVVFSSTLYVWSLLYRPTSYCYFFSIY